MAISCFTGLNPVDTSQKDTQKTADFGFVQGRPTQVGLWAADKLFSHNLGRNLSKT
jgi:hypothetical protein